MHKFLKNLKGSVTVMVTMILIPTFFFNGFLVDMARYKLYSDQAVMLADNYAESILSEYDEVLKELYGVFSIAQGSAEQEYIENALKDYITYSMNPNGDNSGKNGFMPYADSQMLLTKEYIPQSRLSNKEVLSSQVGDYMKYRIVGVLADPENDVTGVLDAVADIDKQKENVELSEAYDDFAEAASEADDAMREFYNALIAFNGYEDYIGDTPAKGLNRCFSNYGIFEGLINQDPFYISYIESFNPVPVPEPVSVGDDDEESTEPPDPPGTMVLNDELRSRLSDLELYSYVSNEKLYPGEVKNVVAELFNHQLKELEEAHDTAYGAGVNFENYSDRLNTLNSAKDKLLTALVKVDKTKNEVKSEYDGASEDLTTEIDKQVKAVENGNLVSTAEVNDVYNKLSNNQTIVNSHKAAYEALHEKIINERDIALSTHSTVTFTNDTENISLDGYNNYKVEPAFSKLDNLYGSAHQDSDKAAKKKEKEAKNKANTAQDALKKEEGNGARDIPKIGDELLSASTDTGVEFSLKGVFGQFTKFLEGNLLENSAAVVLDKYYLTAYDCNMFTNRITNENDETDAQTLSGYKYTDKINYVYQAEQEYLLAGNYSSKKNLMTVKSRIVMFRMIMNYYNTYSIASLNNSINAATVVADANPLLKVALDQAIRIAVAAMETAEDWKALMKNEKVLLSKTSVKDMKALDGIKDWLGVTASGEESSGLKLNYGNYLQIMMLFFTSHEDLAVRTANLMMINVNNVKKGSPSELTDFSAFRIKNAYTAVDVTFSGNLKFAVMPPGFARKTMDSNGYSKLQSIENYNYRFSMVRSY